ILAKSIPRSLDNQPTLPEHDAHVATLDRRRGCGRRRGYFGARLALAGAAVRFVARGAHLAAIRRDGLRVRSMTEGERVVKIDAVETLAGGDPADAVLFCVKSYDTEGAAAALAPARGPDAAGGSVSHGGGTE